MQPSRLPLLFLLFGLIGTPSHAGPYEDGERSFKARDYAAAFAQWRPLAESGDPQAQYQLGLMYSRGLGVPEDYDQAARWMRRSAEQGLPLAQARLGTMYSEGKGVRLDPVEAYKWFVLAAEANVGTLAMVRDDLGNRLTDEQRAEGQARAARFRPHLERPAPTDR